MIRTIRQGGIPKTWQADLIGVIGLFYRFSFPRRHSKSWYCGWCAEIFGKLRGAFQAWPLVTIGYQNWSDMPGRVLWSVGAQDRWIRLPILWQSDYGNRCQCSPFNPRAERTGVVCRTIFTLSGFQKVCLRYKHLIFDHVKSFLTKCNEDQRHSKEERCWLLVLETPVPILQQLCEDMQIRSTFPTDTGLMWYGP